MSGLNLAIDTSNYPNHLQEFARRHGQRCWQNPAYKSSKYISIASENSGVQWMISATQTETLCNGAHVQPPSTHFEEDLSGINQNATDPITIEKEVLDLQRFIQGRQVEEEEEFWDIETRLIPPPMPTRRIKVKFRFIGIEAPRIFFDPDRD